MIERKYKNGDKVLYMHQEECIVTDAHYMVYPKHEAWEYYIKNENGVFKAIEEELELVVDNSTTKPKKSRRNKNKKK